MSQTQKRSAARDISDLKARLGLKRGGPKSGPQAAAPAPGGIVPPPGAQRSGSIPAPPGMAPPQPQIPDAAQDPFGAMNAMATHGTAARAPEIVVVNDGKPVENVERKSAARFAKIGAIVLAPLVLGMVVGEMSSNAQYYNQTIAEAAELKADVDAVKSGLSEVQNQFLIAKQRGGGKFVASDAKLTEALANLDVTRPTPGKAYRSALHALPDGTAAKVYAFYAKSAQFYEQLDAHIKRAQEDGKAITAAKTKLENMTPYGAYVSLPDADAAAKGAQPKVVLVELGQPVCENRRQKPPCPPAGFTYRKQPKGPWQSMDIAKPASGQVGADTLLLLQGNAILTSMLAGSTATVAQAAYMTRMAELSEKLEELIKLGNEVEKILKAQSSEGKRFTFFM